MEQISSNRTIAKNTIFLYGRLLFNLVVSLYTSRVVFQILGVTDMGVFQVVAGIITLFTFFNGGLAAATSRFLAFELARDNSFRFQRTFSASLNVHILFAVIVLLLGETVGLWIVYHKLVIPEGRMTAALIVYQCTVGMMVLSMLQVPYNAAIIAYERMNVFAYIGIGDTLLKLIACFMLMLISFDHLITYGLLLLLFSFLIFTVYLFYCKYSFKNCKWTLKWDKEIAKPILVFSGWGVAGNFSFGLKQQGQSILLNMFFGVGINAACGFANTIYGAVVGFANNFMLSVRPAIIKAYSLKEYRRMQELIILSSKFSFFFMMLLTIPFIIDCEFILSLWLGTPPAYTANICRLMLLIILGDSLFSSVKYGITATGKNKAVSLLNSIVYLSYLPMIYVLLRFFLNPYYPFFLLLILELIKNSICTMLLKKNMMEFSMSTFYKEGISPCIVVFIITLSIIYGTLCFIELEGWWHLMCTILLEVTIGGSAIFLIGLKQDQRSVLKSYAYKLCHIQRSRFKS